MRTWKHFLYGLFGVIFIVGAVGSVASPQNPPPDPCNPVTVACQITDPVLDEKEKILFERNQRRRNLLLKLLENFPPCGPGTQDIRLVVSKDGNKVCDNKTGYWWERSPSPSTFTWEEAINHCANLTLSGKTWRLPEIKEFISLVDYREFNPALPDGNPFMDVQSGRYWSATRDTRNPAHAWTVHVIDGPVDTSHPDITFNYAWCVSGAPNGN